MANTPQAKKRIRRNDKRAEINGNRMGRIRTFVKKVESAIEGGDKTAAAEALQAAQPELGRPPQEHRLAQDLALEQASRRALIRGLRAAPAGQIRNIERRARNPRRAVRARARQ